MQILIDNLGYVICEFAYPLIVDLYSIFEKLSTFVFLSNDYIKTIWNNLYVLVGVVVLFAIAVKLIGAIVNPDTLVDGKKGVKGVYMRTVIAVVLIFLVPMLFSYSFEIQQKLVDSNFLISRIFGYKIAEGEDVGQVLAWTTFKSFCTLADDADDADKSFYYLLEGNVTKNNLAELFTRSSLNFHPILCSLSGILVAYELFLLCMDTMFRAVKLSFLELMVPLILGAYVFNGDILKKWLKEFFSTYLSLFLKLIAVGFMIIAFATISAQVEKKPFFADSFRQGLFNLLFIIALLQLVKKLPDLINTIFGTQIKDRGGIKGRLGEMAGIGGMAQKAWTSLGTGAKNLALSGGRLVGAAGALALNAGAKGMQKGAYNLSDKLKKSSEKGGKLSGLKSVGSKALGFIGNKEGVGLQNTKFGRGVKAAGTLVKDSWKGKGITEIAKNTKDAYGKISDPKDTVAIRKNFEDAMESGGTGINIATGKHNAKDQNGEYKKRSTNLTELGKTNDMAKKVITNGSTEKQFGDSVSSSAVTNGMNEIWNNRDKVSTGIDNIINNARYYGASKGAIDKLDAIKTKFNQGAVSLEDKDIRDLAEIGTKYGSSSTSIADIWTAHNRQKAGVEALVNSSDFSELRSSLSSMIGLDSINNDNVSKILKKSEIGGDNGLKATVEASVKMKDQDLQVSLDATGNETLKTQVGMLKENAIGAATDALKSDIYGQKTMDANDVDKLLSTTAPTPTPTSTPASTPTPTSTTAPTPTPTPVTEASGRPGGSTTYENVTSGFAGKTPDSVIVQQSQKLESTPTVEKEKIVEKETVIKEKETGYGETKKESGGKEGDSSSKETAEKIEDLTKAMKGLAGTVESGLTSVAAEGKNIEKTIQQSTNKTKESNDKIVEKLDEMKKPPEDSN